MSVSDAKAWHEARPNGFNKTLGGFGRAVLVQSGPSSITSQTSTVYAACARSPLGKIHQVSQPYAPGGVEYWTVYAFDALMWPILIV